MSVVGIGCLDEGLGGELGWGREEMVGITGWETDSQNQGNG